MPGPDPKTISVAALLLSLAALSAAQGPKVRLAMHHQSDQSRPPTDKWNAVSVLGCLDESSPDFFLSDENGDVYRLVGAVPDLSKYVGAEIRVAGTIDGSTQPLPTLHAISVKKVAVKAPRLSSSFSNPVAWRTENNPIYGLKFSYPQSFSAVADSGGGVEANFPVETGTIGLGRLEIPDEVYPGTNFMGGAFGFFVNTEITNRASCEQFAKSDSGKRSFVTIHGIRYALSSEGYVGSSAYDFHTFQNGLCYELVFSLGERNIRMGDDLGCMVPALSESDEWNLMLPIMRTISFVRTSSRPKAAAKP